MAFDNLDFLNTNTLRSYPIKEGVTKVSVDGTFTIPDDFIVDFQLAATASIDTRFYISKIINVPESIVVEIKDHNNVICGFFVITTSTHSLYKTYYLTPDTSYIGANGKLTVASINTMLLAPSGTFDFTLATAELETRTILPSVDTITRLNFYNSDGALGASVTGNIKIAARNNLKFTLGTTTITDDTVIIDVGNGLGLNAPCDSDKPCIKTINNVEPDTDGNFTIVPAECASISTLTSGNGIMFSDTCCKPCMGCDEISALTERVIQIETDMLKLRDHYTNLQALITEFSNIMNYTCDC